MPAAVLMVARGEIGISCARPEASGAVAYMARCGNAPFLKPADIADPMLVDKRAAGWDMKAAFTSAWDYASGPRKGGPSCVIANVARWCYRSVAQLEFRGRKWRRLCHIKARVADVYAPVTGFGACVMVD